MDFPQICSSYLQSRPPRRRLLALARLNLLQSADQRYRCVGQPVRTLQRRLTLNPSSGVDCGR